VKQVAENPENAEAVLPVLEGEKGEEIYKQAILNRAGLEIAQRDLNKAVEFACAIADDSMRDACLGTIASACRDNLSELGRVIRLMQDPGLRLICWVNAATGLAREVLRQGVPLGRFQGCMYREIRELPRRKY